jgi:hypothetical protein
VSGAQWSPERLEELAYAVSHYLHASDEVVQDAADALRDFARVVSVLERTDISVVEVTDEGHSVAQVWERNSPIIERRGDTPLAAILALADALDAGDTGQEGEA